jgi:hypothetical protein
MHARRPRKNPMMAETEMVAIDKASEVANARPPEATDADNKALAALKQAHLKYVVTFFYVTFVFLISIGAAVLSFVVTHNAPDASASLQTNFEVLVLPGANRDCGVRPDPAALQFCVILQNCKDSPLTPEGRCGLGPGSVFYNGNGFICVNSEKQRIVGSAGVYSRKISTYQVSCSNRSDSTSCLNRLLPKSDFSCELLWPTLLSVIDNKLTSSSYVQDPSGSFNIYGPNTNDPDIWFNMCGFCSFAEEVKMYVSIYAKMSKNACLWSYSVQAE